MSFHLEGDRNRCDESCRANTRRLGWTPQPMNWLMMAAALLLAAMPATAQTPDRLIVHEWAVIQTFASDQGDSALWQPWDYPAVQPSFVGRYKLPPTIRPCAALLDVPAVFFRVDKPVNLTMQYEWLEGHFASCYPLASWQSHSLRWPDVTIMPQGGPLLTEAADTTYYHPRRTTASFVRVDNLGHKQFERFISLRAMGNLPLPVKVTQTGRNLKLDMQPDAQVRHVLVINQPASDAAANENHQASQVRMTLHDLSAMPGRAGRASDPGQTLTLPQPTQTQTQTMHVDIALAQLRQLLNRQGLYPDEAAAVLSSAKAQWFAPGLRVIYLLPQSHVESHVKVNITPAPTEHRRLYAVCVEVLTPETIASIHAKLASLPAGDATAHEAFLNGSPVVRLALQRMLEGQSPASQLVKNDQQREMIARLLGVAPDAP